MNPSASSVTSRSTRSLPPAMMIRGRCTNPGVMPGSPNTALISVTVSCSCRNRAARSGGMMPCAGGIGMPLPRVISTRPPLTWSRVVRSRVTVRGFHRPVFSTNVPSPIVVVARATAASVISGDSAPTARSGTT